MRDRNIGLKGLESLRIDGMKIGNLPLGQGNEAREGLADFLKTEKETLRNNITAKFPKHKRDFLEAQIKECRGNIKRIKNFKEKLKEDILEYRQLIKNCEYRKSELAKYNKENPDDLEKMKEIRLKYPPYDEVALEQQIVQFEEAIERCNDVIEQDYESINEIQQILVLVEQKERELKNV